MLYLIEIIPLGLGILLHSKQTILVNILVFFAVQTLTRTDNPHAARLFIMLPALLYLVSLGMKFIYDRSAPSCTFIHLYF